MHQLERSHSTSVARGSRRRSQFKPRSLTLPQRPVRPIVSRSASTEYAPYTRFHGPVTYRSSSNFCGPLIESLSRTTEIGFFVDPVLVHCTVCSPAVAVDVPARQVFRTAQLSRIY